MGWATEYHEMIAEAAARGEARMRKKVLDGSVEPFILMYQPVSEQSGAWGKIELVPTSEWNRMVDSGWQLATGEYLRIDVPYDRWGIWIRERATRLPLIGMGSRQKGE